MNKLLNIGWAVCFHFAFCLLCACSSSEPNRQDVQMLEKVVVANVALFTKCYEQGRKTEPEIAGKIAVKVEVSKQGKVKEAVLNHNDLGQSVGSCFIAVFRGMEFPKLSKTTVWEDSFCFEPNPDGGRCKKTH